MRLLFPLLIWSVFMAQSVAQSSPVYLPKINSQYLTQVRDGGARLLVVGYMDDQAYLHTIDGRQPFSQASMLRILADPQQQAEHALPAVRLEADRSLPMHYLHDLYFWLQLAGYTQLHLTVLEASNPKEKRYVAVPIAPFFYPEQAYALAAETRGAEAVTPLQMAQKVHPHTERLSSVQDPALRLRLLRTTTLAYVPQQILPVELQANGQVNFQGQVGDPLVLSALVQSALATHYGNSYQPAAPQIRLWLEVQTDSKATAQHYAVLLGTLSEAYHLYWEELAFNQYQKTYPELNLQERDALSQAAPMLLLEYDPAFKAYWEAKLKSEQLKLWQIQP